MTFKINPGDAQIFHADGESLAAKKVYVNKLIEEHQNINDPFVSDFGICMAIGKLSGVIEELETAHNIGAQNGPTAAI